MLCCKAPQHKAMNHHETQIYPTATRPPTTRMLWYTPAQHGSLSQVRRLNKSVSDQ